MFFNFVDELRAGFDWNNSQGIRRIIVREGERLTEDEVRAYCQGQIAHYKIPRYIRFVEGFPMTVTGKIQKFQIREQMKQALGLHDAATA